MKRKGVIVIIGLLCIIFLMSQFKQDLWDLSSKLLKGKVVSIEQTSSWDKIKKYKNITIEYDNSEEYIINSIVSCVETADNKNDKMFGKQNLPDITIKLYNDITKFTNDGSLPNGSDLGYFTYDKKRNTFTISLMLKYLIDGVISEEASDFFYQGLSHEYTHYRFRVFMNSNNLDYNKVPVWFKEGVACYNSGQKFQFPSDTYYTDLMSLITPDQWFKAYKSPYFIYDISYYAIDYLVRNYKESVIINILKNTSKLDFYESFQTITSKTIEKFQIDMASYYRRNWK